MHEAIDFVVGAAEFGACLLNSAPATGCFLEERRLLCSLCLLLPFLHLPLDLSAAVPSGDKRALEETNYYKELYM
jgi:hypothetical protein